MDDELRTTVRLLERSNDGDDAAVDELFTRYGPRVRRIVALRLGRSARDLADFDDVVQESLLKAFQGLDGLRNRTVGAFRNWLSKCVESALVDRLRHRNAKKRGEGRERRFGDYGSDVLSSTVLGNKGPRPSDFARAKELEERLEQALLELDERSREVIVLRKLCGMSYAEIGHQMGGAKEVTVRQAVFKALSRLKGQLGLDDGDD